MDERGLLDIFRTRWGSCWDRGSEGEGGIEKGTVNPYTLDAHA